MSEIDDILKEVESIKSDEQSFEEAIREMEKPPQAEPPEEQLTEPTLPHAHKARKARFPRSACQKTQKSIYNRYIFGGAVPYCNGNRNDNFPVYSLGNT